MAVVNELDYFSLTVFKGIYDTGQAAQTAKMLNVSAPKVSRCLTALRNQLGDELFYRRNNGLLPTPKAEQLYGPIEQLLEGFALLEKVANADFEETPIVLAILPQFLPVLAKVLRCEQFAGLAERLEVRPWSASSVEELRRGELDLALTVEYPKDSNFEVTSLALLKQLYMVAAEQHPIWQELEGFSLETMAKYPFIYNVLAGFNDRIDPLESHFINNDIRYHSATGAASRDDWYAKLLSSNALSLCGAGSMAESIAKQDGLRVWQIPQSESQSLHEGQDWPQFKMLERPLAHQRYDQATRQWLRRFLQKLIR